MKKIIAAFDGLKYSKSTERYATDLACKDPDRVLTGVFLEDFTYHSYKLFDMVGSQGVSPEKVHQLMAQDTQKRTQSVKDFAEACQNSNITTLIHHDKSIAIQELLRETIYGDLLIIGAHETLSHMPEQAPTQFIKDLLIDVQCPVLMVPQEYKQIEQIVLLYDGDPSSVFAAKMFSYLLPELKDLPVEVISVQEREDGIQLSGDKLIQEFIQCHYPNAAVSQLIGDPEIKIQEHLAGQENALVVLGAYRRSTVSRWFKPSMADVLMRTINTPLFIAHYR